MGALLLTLALSVLCIIDWDILLCLLFLLLFAIWLQVFLMASLDSIGPLILSTLEGKMTYKVLL